MIYGLFAIAVFVSIIMIIQSIIGDSIQLFPGRIENAATFGFEYEARRILPPGQTLVYVLLLTSISYAVTTQRESIVSSGYVYILIGLLAIGIMLTYNRNYWISAIGSMSILFVIEKGKGKRRFLLMCITLFMIVVTSSYLLSMFKGQSDIMSAIVSRFSSLFTVDKLYRSDSLEDRYLENHYAMIKIYQYPFFGSGIGTDYIPSKYLSDDPRRLSGYIHNVYLWLLLNYGGIGFIAFIIFYLRFIVRGFVKMKGIKDEFLRSSIIGFTLSGLSMLAIGFVNPVFMQWFSIVVIFIIIGLVEAIIQINDKETGEIPQ
jgi:O-antigen ligase